METQYSTLDVYQIIRTIGKGHFAKVKEALNTTNNLKVAIKIMKISNPYQQQRLEQLFDREVASMYQLSHPQIVQIYAFCKSGLYNKKQNQGQYQCMYIVMECCANYDLFNIIFKTGALDESTCRTIFTQLVNALQFCHSRNITHRDIKPENILFDEQLNPKLADFGFSRDMGNYDQSLNSVLGTPLHMAPEIFTQNYQGDKIDVFALGVTLFIMINRFPPFHAPKPQDKFYKGIVNNDPKCWEKHEQRHRPGYFSNDFRDLVSKMLQLDPGNRPSLEQILQHPWTNGPQQDIGNLKALLGQRIQNMTQLAERQRAARDLLRKRQQEARIFRGETDDIEEDSQIELQKVPESLIGSRFSQILTALQPNEIILKIQQLLQISDCQYEQTSLWKFKASLSDLECEIALYSTSEDLNLIEIQKVSGSFWKLNELFESLQSIIEESF